MFLITSGITGFLAVLIVFAISRNLPFSLMFGVLAFFLDYFILERPLRRDRS